MATWSFHSANSMIFGRGSLDQLADCVRKRHAKRVFVITDSILNRLGIVDQVVRRLQAAGFETAIFDAITPEPPVEQIQDAINSAKTFRPDLLIGLGGGSNMDAAKLAAVVLAHGGDCTDYVGDCRVPGPIFPLICIPTTSGTGSEVSAAAVFTDTAKQMKVSTLSPYLRPLVALIDPSLTDGCPPKVSADSGIDALTHAIEAYCAVDREEFRQRPPGGETVYQGRNPLSTTMARECILQVGQFLKRAVENGGDHEARDGMAMAATLGGLAFSNAGVALVHAMEYPVGGTVHVSHGAGNGLLLPYVMEYHCDCRKQEIASIGQLLTGRDQADGIQAVKDLRKAIGIPDRLREIGVTREMLPIFAERAFGIKRLMRTNPRMPESAQEILEIYQQAY
jgi:alcohol dehydrogenase